MRNRWVCNEGLFRRLDEFSVSGDLLVNNNTTTTEESVVIHSTKPSWATSTLSASVLVQKGVHPDLSSVISGIGSVRMIRMHSMIYRRRSVESGKHDSRQGLVLARSVMMYAMLIDTFLESRVMRGSKARPRSCTQLPVKQ